MRAVTIITMMAAATLNSAYAGTNPPPSVVKAEILEVFPDAPVMVAIAKCESELEHFDPETGEPKRHKPAKATRGKKPQKQSSAMGLFQILAKTHGPAARKHGLDLHTLEGNIRYARVLYKQSGTRPWKASKACWGGSQRKRRS